MDHVSPTKRSEIMRAVNSKGSGPEMSVRRLAHGMGLRFKLHEKGLPGSPDMIFPRWRVALFIHGCFWHRHNGCNKATTPKSNVEFWLEKFARNIERDAKVIEAMTAKGWRCEVIWQCETRDTITLAARLKSIFNSIPKYQ